MQVYTVSQGDDNIRIDRWFKRHLKDVSFTQVAKLIRKGQIKLNGKKVDVSSRVVEGDQISFKNNFVSTGDKPKKAVNIPQEVIKEIQDAVIFKDEVLLAINKPAGLAVQGGSKISYSIDDLAEYLKFDNEEKPKLVHRLDRETSGILILARSTASAAKLAELFKKKTIDKFYIALLAGVPRPFIGKIDLPLEKEREVEFEKVKHNKDGAKAVTLYEVLDHAASQYSLVRFKLLTGKTHQLRAHSSLIDCPIVGDRKYGRTDVKQSLMSDKLHLHARHIEFNLDGKNYNIMADLPKYFDLSLENIGLSKDKV
jgi:23S rRNA pseudouridine955/2504/2580 synthase